MPLCSRHQLQRSELRACALGGKAWDPAFELLVWRACFRFASWVRQAATSACFLIFRAFRSRARTDWAAGQIPGCSPAFGGSRSCRRTGIVHQTAFWRAAPPLSLHEPLLPSRQYTYFQQQLKTQSAHVSSDHSRPRSSLLRPAHCPAAFRRFRTDKRSGLLRFGSVLLLLVVASVHPFLPI